MKTEIDWPKLHRKFCETWGIEDKEKSIFGWFKEALTPKKRTLTQNRALHLYFKLISEQLNEAGYTFTNTIGVECRFTEVLVKESIWKPTQLEMFGFESTTKLNSEMINELIDVFSLHFGERGIYIEFPSWKSYFNKLDAMNL